MDGSVFNVALTYEAVAAPEGGNTGEVAVAKFSDTRQDKEIVGEVRNAMGLKTAKVLIGDQDAGAWAANALAAELERAGFRVAKVNDPVTANQSIVIQGSVSHLYTKMYMAHRTTVKVKMLVTKSRVPVLNKEYVGQAKAGAMFASTGEYEGVIQTALQEVMKQAIPEIIEAVK